MVKQYRILTATAAAIALTFGAANAATHRRARPRRLPAARP